MVCRLIIDFLGDGSVPGPNYDLTESCSDLFVQLFFISTFHTSNSWFPRTIFNNFFYQGLYVFFEIFYFETNDKGNTIVLPNSRHISVNLR